MQSSLMDQEVECGHVQGLIDMLCGGASSDHCERLTKERFIGQSFE